MVKTKHANKHTNKNYEPFGNYDNILNFTLDCIDNQDTMQS